VNGRVFLGAVEPRGVSTKRPSPLDDDGRERLLHAVANRPVGEQLLAHLVLTDGLTVAQAVAVRCCDLSDGAVTVPTKTGKCETRDLFPLTAELARGVIDDAANNATLITGRSGRPLSTAAARRILLGLAHEHGLPVRSLHQLRAKRRAVAAA
jgi:integrase